ncbi:hypothetical protein M080_6488 [Bacteroides fragilis str. 3397 T10]|nr:hypothetical protein M080_6488 [Bacteroides fragilis str. 3397 T10]
MSHFAEYIRVNTCFTEKLHYFCSIETAVSETAVSERTIKKIMI